MSRRRHNNASYELEVRLGSDKISFFYNLDTLQDIADTLNSEYFSGFKVVTRTMISNWIHYPNKPRRDFANAFHIERKVC